MHAYTDPREVYDLLLDYCGATATATQLTLGRVWTLCEAGLVQGMSMSPDEITRTLPWPGTLAGRPLRELAAWVKEWDPQHAAVGMAACNAALGLRASLPHSELLEPLANGDNNLRVFDHFLPQLAGRRVVVVGRYPGLDRWSERHGVDLTVLERRPGAGDLPDPAAEWVLPDAEWVFLTASSIPNKTFPRLMSLSRHATVVLMGPTLPWLAEFHHFGVDYLAGIEVVDPSALRQVVAEGGGVRLFDQAVRYRVARLDGTATWEWLRRHISQVAAEKDRLNRAMEQWYAHHPINQRFPQLAQRESVGLKLSRLDTCAHALWPRLPPEQRKAADG
ncbi:DUF364 domain-containing protein [Methylogaea oryzae]|nr:DUF364 domain-containing protein [Methylogaea oryzae]